MKKKMKFVWCGVNFELPAECLIALNSGPSASRVGTLPSGRYTAEIASLYDCIKEFYPDYKLPEKSVEELKPFLVGPYSKVLAA